MLLGDVLCSTETLHASPLPPPLNKRLTLAAQGSYVAAMLLSLRGVTSILIKNYLIDAEDSFVTEQTKALLECIAPAPAAQAGGKQQQQQQSSHQGTKTLAEAVKKCTACVVRTATPTSSQSLGEDYSDDTKESGKHDENATEGRTSPSSGGENKNEEPLVPPSPFVVYGLHPVKLM